MIGRRSDDKGLLLDTAGTCGPRPMRARVILSSLLAAGALIGATAALKHLELSGIWRLVIALLPVPAYIVFLLTQIQAARQMDELHQRIHLEALVFAFPTSFVGILTTWLIWLAGFLPWLSFSDSVAFFLVLMIGLHSLGYLLATRRYR